MNNEFFQINFINNKLIISLECNQNISLGLTVLKMKDINNNLIKTGPYLVGVIAVFLDMNHQNLEINIPEDVYEISVKIWDDIHRTYDYVTLQENRIIKYQQERLM